MKMRNKTWAAGGASNSLESMRLGNPGTNGSAFGRHDDADDI